MSEKHRGRKIVVNDRDWQWKLSNYSFLYIWNDKDHIHRVRLEDVIHMNFWAMEHDWEKRNLHVTPGHIAKYIKENLI